MRVALAALLLAFLTAATARALPQATWLVAIGNNEGDNEDVTLLYAERDAQALVGALQTESGVQARYTTVLLGRGADEVRATLQDLNARIREESAKVPTALIVFYSGHSDADALHLGGSHLRMDELKTLVEGSPASLRLLIVDACRSGSVTRVKGIRPAEPFRLELAQLPGAEGLVIMTSSAAGESSQESDELRGSFFTHHLVNALRGAGDQNGDGIVTLAEAYAYTYAQTLRSSGSTLDLQHPTYSYDVKGKGDVILARPREAVGRIGYLKLGDAFVYLISERHEGGPVIAELATSQPSTSLALPAGDYFVQERRPDEYREYQVKLGSGREVDLSSLRYRSVRYDRLVRARGGDKLYSHGLLVLAGAHGSMLAGEAPSPQLIVGYGVDLPWFTVGARLRGATVSSSGDANVLPRRHDEYGFGVTLQRFVDLQPFSLSFGVLIEATLHEQVFTGARQAPSRSVLGSNFGGIVSIERHLTHGLALHLEGGPVTGVFPEATIASDGHATGQTSAAAFTWWTAGGLVWRH